VIASMLGFALGAIVVSLEIQRTDPLTNGLEALSHVALAAGRLLGIGGVAAALAGFHRLRALRGRLARRAAVVALFVAASALFLPDDLAGFAARHAAIAPPRVTTALFCVACGLLLAAGVEAGRLFRRPIGRAMAVLASGAAFGIEPRLFTGQYPGFHVVLVLGAASFAGSALVGIHLPRRLGRRARILVVAFGALGLSAFVAPTSAQVRFLLARDGDVMAPFDGWLRARSTSVARGGGHAGSEWLVARADLPDAPPSPIARPVRNPIVLLVTIDCLRFDVVGGPHPRARMPRLAELIREGAFFTRAQAPGTSTVYTLTSLFSGKYYSELEWSGARRGTVFPRDDETVRFPAALARAGVWTVHAASFDWLANEYGVARGFDVVDYEALPGPRWKPMESLVDALVRRLGEVGERSAFLYAHINEAHAPYARGGASGSDRERYLRVLELIDAELGRLLDAVERRGLGARTFVVVTADHGEAFGEHRRVAHGNSLYQELAHVPLVVHGPGIAPAQLDARVSLMDLGPTVLDLFGSPTPATFMGESLYPALVGRPFAPTRPILAQLGHLRSIVTSEGLKVIEDTHGGVVEVYDLEADPREARNLVGESRAEAREALSELETFFEVHRFRRAGYVEPYREF
jgi:hypothetical protein